MNSKGILLFITPLFFSYPAYAQEVVGANTGTNAGTAENLLIEELIITGQKMKKNRQEITDSVSVVSGEELMSMGISDLRDSLRLSANINYSPSNNGNNGFSIRGINSEGVGEAGGNPLPTALLVIDGAAQSLEGVRKGARGVWDLDTIEVFRGPQITLGRNALTGAIHVNTNDPTPEFESSTRFVVDSKGNEKAIMFSGPIFSDQLMFRFAAEELDKTVDISYNNPEIDWFAEEEFYSTRGKLRYEPASLPGFSAQITHSSAHDDPAITAVSRPQYKDRILSTLSETVEHRINDVDNTILEIDYEMSSAWTFHGVATLTKTETNFSTLPGYSRDEVREDKDTSYDMRVNFISDSGDVKFVSGIFAGRYQNNTDSVIQTFIQQPVTRTVTQTVAVDSCVNLDFQADGDGRWYEFYSDAYYQLNLGDQAYQITTLPTLIPVGGGDVAFPSLGDWENVGSVYFSSSGTTGTGEETATLGTAVFDFHEYAAADDVMIIGAPYTSQTDASEGTINLLDGEVQSFDGNINMSFIYEAVSGTAISQGSLQLTPDSNFDLAIGDPTDLSQVGDPVWAWDFNGNYALSDNQSCTVPDESIDIEVVEFTGEFNNVWATIQDLESQTQRKNAAFYSELDWRINDWTRLIAGFRYEQESMDFSLTFRNTSPNRNTYGETEFKVIQPKLGVMFDIANGHSLGFVATKGYRGGFVDRDPNVFGRLGQVKPEVLWDYEIVYRGEWLNRRLVTNANIFLYDWQDQQISVKSEKDRRFTVVENAGRSQVHGLELTVDAWLLPGLSAGVSAGYLKTEFLDFETTAGDFTGNEFPEAPRYSASVRLNYTSNSGWFIGGDFSYQSEYFATGDLFNIPSGKLNDVTLFFARAGYEDPEGRFRFNLGVDNVLDNYYLTGRDNFGGAYIGDARVYSFSTQFWY